MRDVHNFVKGPYTVKTEWKLSGNWVNWSSYSASLQGTRTYRDDASSTQKIGDHYAYSTDYEAFFFLASSGAFSYEWDTASGNRHHRTFGDSGSTKWPFPQDIMTHGCSTAYPYRPSISNSVIGRAESMVYDRIQQNDFNVGQSLGELRETVGFLSDSLLRFLKFLSLLRKGRVAEAAGLLGLSKRGLRITGDGAASTYLAYQYGVKPLMSDAYNAAKFIREGILPYTIGNVVVRAKDPLGDPTPYNTVRVTSRLKYDRGIEIGVRYRVKYPELYNLDRYGLLDPLALAWELVPLSFVVDWFTGLGGFLNALTQPFGLGFVDAYRTSYVVGSGTYEYHTSDQYNIVGALPKVRVNAHSSYRYKYLSWPIPNVYLDFGINLNKALSLAALAKVRS